MSISERRPRRGPALLAGIVLALSAAATQAATTLKIATLSPEGSAWMELLRAGARDVTARTEGRIDFKFYPGGVMGDDKAVLRKIRLGQLHGAVLTAGGLVQTYEDIQLYGLPLVFESYDEVDHVRGRLDPVLIAGLREQGFETFGFAEVGFAYAMSKNPVTSVADVQAQKVWTPDGDPGSARALQSFGISPIPLSIADVLSGLQTGLINGVTVPPVAAIALQWHNQIEYLMDLPLLYVYGLLAVANRPFQRIADADQAVMREVFAGVVTEVTARARKDHVSAMDALFGQGVKQTTPSAAEVVEWREYARRANEALVVDGLVSRDLLERMEALLEEYRSRGD
ncbi:MAG: TRAP transporter substrate-binding protein DctP [Pseudomonadales bacterium]